MVGVGVDVDGVLIFGIDVVVVVIVIDEFVVDCDGVLVLMDFGFVVLSVEFVVELCMSDVLVCFVFVFFVEGLFVVVVVVVVGNGLDVVVVEVFVVFVVKIG